MDKNGKRGVRIFLIVWGLVMIILGVFEQILLSRFHWWNTYWWIAILTSIVGLILFMVGVIKTAAYSSQRKKIQKSNIKSAQDITLEQMRDLNIEIEELAKKKRVIIEKKNIMKKQESILEKERNSD